MSNQPEALRLADEIDEKWWRWADNPTIELKAAAELRRQHAEIAALKEALTQARTAPPALRTALAEPKHGQPLTDEEIDAVTEHAVDALLDLIYMYKGVGKGFFKRLREVARAIERAHNITGGNDE